MIVFQCKTGLFNISFTQELDEEDIDPFHMPVWRKFIWSLFFFMMVATADIGNIIGKSKTNILFD